MNAISASVEGRPCGAEIDRRARSSRDKSGHNGPKNRRVPPMTRIERSPDLLRPIIAAKDVAEDEGDRRRQIAEAVFDSFAPQLDLSFAAAIYGLVGLFLGSLIGELLVAALLPRDRFAR